MVMALRSVGGFRGAGRLLRRRTCFSPLRVCGSDGALGVGAGSCGAGGSNVSDGLATFSGDAEAGTTGAGRLMGDLVTAGSACVGSGVLAGVSATASATQGVVSSGGAAAVGVVAGSSTAGTVAGCSGTLATSGWSAALGS